MKDDDGDTIEITTEAGGDGTRLRYYFVMSSADGQNFSAEQKKFVLSAFKQITKEIDAKVENIEFSKNYALITALIPLDFPVGGFVEDVITVSNLDTKILKHHYLVVNTQKQTQEEIEGYLKELMH